MKTHTIKKSGKRYKPVYKPAYFILAAVFLTTTALAGIVAKPPKELPQHLVKLQDDLIIEMEKAEELIYDRGAVYEKEDVILYINKIAQKISSNIDPDESANIEIKIIRDPMVNAFALPNGSIYLHTGALARLENEAQLAFLLAHEVSHVVNKDSVFGTHSYHKKTIVFKIVDIALAPTSIFFGILGDLAQMGFGLLHATTLTGYGRDIEARADKEGILHTGEQGYHSYEAANLIEIFLKEKEKYQIGPEIFFLMSHPSNLWRLKRLRKIVSKKYGEDAEGEIRQEEFLANMAEIKIYNATLNMKMDRLEHAADNIQWVLEKFPDDPEAHFVAGEIYRLKALDKKKLNYELNYKKWRELNKDRKKGELEQKWREEATGQYNLALKCEPDYANAYKGLGILHNDTGDWETALTYLNKYLVFNPGARDKRYINSLIKKIKKIQEKEEKERKEV